MRQEKYLDKAISKLEKDLRKAGLSDMYTISGRIENRIPILDVSNNEIGSARTYNLANAYIMYLEEDVSAAESFKDTRREIMADVCRENPIEVQPEETFPMNSNVQPDLSVEDLDTPVNFNVFSYVAAEANRIVNENRETMNENIQENVDNGESALITPWEDEEEQEDTPLVIHEQDDLELEHEYYGAQEETNMPDLDVTSYDRMQEFDDYDTNYESEFAAKMKELFEWKEPETSFTLRSENGIHNLYVGETGIVINLTEANERYQTNSQSFLEIGLDLYNNDYKERLAEQIRENAGIHSGEETEEPPKEEQPAYDTEEYDDDYFPF